MPHARNNNVLIKLKDPAPSKLFYKLNRLAYRLWFKLLVATIVIATFFLMASMFLHEKFDINKSLVFLKDSISSYFSDVSEFEVKKIKVLGASRQLTGEIEDLIGDSLGRKISKLSVSKIREKIIKNVKIKNADVKFSIDGHIEIVVVERQGAVILFEKGLYLLLDEEGIKLSTYKDWSKAPNLPLLVGEGAEIKLKDFILLYGSIQSLVTNIEIYEWIGKRRWNLHFKNKLVVKLPENNLDKGINFLIALKERNFLNGEEISVIDLRNLNRPIIKFEDHSNNKKRSPIL